MKCWSMHEGFTRPYHYRWLAGSFGRCFLNGCRKLFWSFRDGCRRLRAICSYLFVLYSFELLLVCWIVGILELIVGKFITLYNPQKLHFSLDEINFTIIWYSFRIIIIIIIIIFFILQSFDLVLLDFFYKYFGFLLGSYSLRSISWFLRELLRSLKDKVFNFFFFLNNNYPLVFIS